jgi:hypothetical protein
MSDKDKEQTPPPPDRPNVDKVGKTLTHADDQPAVETRDE